MKIRVSGMVCSASGLAMLLVLSGCGPESKDVLAKRDYIPAPKSDVSVPEQSPAMVMQPSPGIAVAMPADEAAAVEVDVVETPEVSEVQVLEKPQPKSYPKFVGNTSKPVVKPGSSSVPHSNAKAGDDVYIVKHGDTLSGIAYRCGVKTADLAAVNGLSQDSIIRVGQKLKLPVGGKAVASSSSKKSAKATSSAKKSSKKVSFPADGIYVVQKNDSLWVIARRFDTTVAKLCEINNIPADKALQLGQKIKLPGAASGVDKAPAEVKPATVPSMSAAGSPASAAAEEASLAGTAVAENAASAQPETVEVVTAEAEISAPVETPAAPTTRTQVIQRDVEVADLCNLFKWDIEEFKKLNPDLPADGILRRDQVITVPVKK